MSGPPHTCSGGSLSAQVHPSIRFVEGYAPEPRLRAGAQAPGGSLVRLIAKCCVL